MGKAESSENMKKLLRIIIATIKFCLQPLVPPAELGIELGEMFSVNNKFTKKMGFRLYLNYLVNSSGREFI